MDDLAVAYPPPAPPMPAKPPRQVGRRLWKALAVLVAVSAVGPALGWLWTLVAPRLLVFKVEGGFAYAEPEPEQLIGAEATYVFLAAGAGLVLAVLAWLVLRRDRGWVVLVALTVGSLVSAWLAWYLGYKIGIGQLRDAAAAVPNGTRLEALIGLRITDLDPHQLWPPKVTGIVAIQALVAAFVYTVIAGFSVYPDLRRPRPLTDAELFAYGPPIDHGHTSTPAPYPGYTPPSTDALPIPPPYHPTTQPPPPPFQPTALPTTQPPAEPTTPPDEPTTQPPSQPTTQPPPN